VVYSIVKEHITMIATWYLLLCARWSRWALIKNLVVAGPTVCEKHDRHQYIYYFQWAGQMALSRILICKASIRWCGPAWFIWYSLSYCTNYPEHKLKEHKELILASSTGRTWGTVEHEQGLPYDTLTIHLSYIICLTVMSYNHSKVHLLTNSTI
jgi:hypothetical protein